MRTRVTGGMLVLAIVLGLATAGCGKRRHGSPSDGLVANGEYTNSFFGFALPVPKGWTVAPQETIDATARSGRQRLAESSDERTKELLRQGEKKSRSYNLLLISEHPVGANITTFNANIVCAATYIGRVRGIKTGADYLNQVANLLKSQNIGYRPMGAPKETQLGGHTFYRQQFSGAINGVPVEQAYFVDLVDGYTLTFIISVGSQDDVPRVEAELGNLRFQ